MRLLTIGEVSDILRTSERKVRDLAIPVVRIGRKRLYDPRDVDEYVKGQKQCLSSKDPVAAIGKRSSSARASGLAEALARHPAVPPKPPGAADLIMRGYPTTTVLNMFRHTGWVAP